MHEREQLQDLLKEARYDKALEVVLTWDRDRVLTGHRGTEKTRLACMLSDVLDYGGLYAEAHEVIRTFGEQARRLSSIKSAKEIFEPADTKQECWALMMAGMSFYRMANREGNIQAMENFELARHVLQMIKDLGISVTGSLSRAWYCIALVHRQRKEYEQAKAAFTTSAESAELGIEERLKSGHSTTSFDYHLARCSGLGTGYIAYDEASLDEAKTALRLARRMVFDKDARFIRAYIEVVHASVIRSGHSNEPVRINQAIEILKSAHETLAPAEGFHHRPYAVRASVELALAYLSRAQKSADDTKKADLLLAENSLRVAQTDEIKLRDPRTYCYALIIASRIQRERGDKEGALQLARDCEKASGGIPFSHIDACITLGEAYYFREEYGAAADAFYRVLGLGRSSRKVTAICHLHLSRTYLGDGQPSKALEHFEQWKLVKAGLQNAFIADFASKISERLDPLSGDFHIPRDGTLVRDYWVTRLHYWLATTALRIAKNHHGHAATLLAVAENTFRGYLKDGGKAGATSAGA
jgi:tetratricopeptide (TPR) repeat protein